MKAILLLLTLTTAAFLTGCGSDTSSTKKPGDDQSPTSKTVKVIDGYLSNVDVYADRNNNDAIDTGEFVASTNSEGSITLSADDLEYNLFATVTAGLSNDADRIGTVTESVTLRAKAGSDVITPFTTLLFDSLVDDATLASTLSMPISILTSDYVELKANSDQAVAAHAFARSAMTLLGNANSQVDSLNIIASLGNLIPAIDDFVNLNGYDELNSTNFIINGERVTTQTIYSNLESYLKAGETWYTVSLNERLASEEGVQSIIFNQTDRTYEVLDSKGAFKFTSDYLADDTKLISPGGVADDFIAITHDIAIVKTSGLADLVVWAKKDLAKTTDSDLITADEFSGKEWHMVFDDSPSDSPLNTIATFNFSPLNGSPEGVVNIAEGETESQATYYVTTEQSQGSIISPLYINHSDTEAPFKLVQIASSESIKIMYDINRDNYFIFSRDENLASSLTATN